MMLVSLRLARAIKTSKATDKLKNHIYDYVITDSKIERDFVEELDTSAEVTVYASYQRVPDTNPGRRL